MESFLTTITEPEPESEPVIDVPGGVIDMTHSVPTEPAEAPSEPQQPKRKAGRPKGSKNKPKPVEVPTAMASVVDAVEVLARAAKMQSSEIEQLRARLDDIKKVISG